MNKRELISLSKSLESEIAQIKQTISNSQKRMFAKMKERDEIINQIENLGDGEAKISDHALLRYLERKLGYDVDALKQQLLSQELKNTIAAFNGNGIFKLNEITFTVKNNIIVTMY